MTELIMAAFRRGYRAALGAVPVPEGAEKPEDIIRRHREEGIPPVPSEIFQEWLAMEIVLAVEQERERIARFVEEYVLPCNLMTEASVAWLVRHIREGDYQ